MKTLPAWVVALPLFLFWGTDAITPLQLLVVGAHEVGHQLAALVEGHALVDLLTTMTAAGHALPRGGTPFFALSAGYLSSFLFSAGFLLLGQDSFARRIVAGLLGAFLLYAGFSWFDEGSVAQIVTMATGIFCVAAGPLASGETLRAGMQVIGVFILLGVPLDIGRDLLASGPPISDAGILASLTGLPELGVMGAWTALTVALAGALRSLLG